MAKFTQITFDINEREVKAFLKKFKIDTIFDEMLNGPDGRVVFERINEKVEKQDQYEKILTPLVDLPLKPAYKTFEDFYKDMKKYLLKNLMGMILEKQIQKPDWSMQKVVETISKEANDIFVRVMYMVVNDYEYEYSHRLIIRGKKPFEI